ncbi:MAG: 4-(cytidine 5'-diphospho)-2-C-methyl-D-erythritol kinase [Candidatus Scalinduaceae bacterium]
MKDNQRNSVISVKAHAKINLFLEILGKRNDGYHEIETVIQEINIADYLWFKEVEKGIKLKCEDKSIPLNEDNLVYKAADLILRECGIKRGVLICLEKKIPVCAGLGGGSSDAAATLKALNMLWEIDLNDVELMELAAELGSDVSFFIKGKTALCEGRGEKVYPIEIKSKLYYLVIFPNIRISTTKIYKNLKIGLTKNRKDVNFFLNALGDCGAEKLGSMLFNRLEKTIFRLYPDMFKFKNSLKCFSFCGLLISGSGSSIFGLCYNRNQAEVIKNKIEQSGIGKVFVTTNAEVPQTTS